MNLLIETKTKKTVMRCRTIFVHRVSFVGYKIFFLIEIRDTKRGKIYCQISFEFEEQYKIYMSLQKPKNKSK